MTEYWVSEKKWHCDVCQCWIKDTPMSRLKHESGEGHKMRAAKKMRESRQAKQQEEMEQREIRKELAEIDRAARQAYAGDCRAGRGGEQAFREAGRRPPPPPPERSGLLNDDAKAAFVEAAHLAAQQRMNGAAASEGVCGGAGLPPGFEGRVPTFDREHEVPDEEIAQRSISDRWNTPKTDAELYLAKLKAETPSEKLTATAVPGEGLDQTTGMGKWGSVVRTEEGEDVDYVVARKVTKRKLAQEAAGIVVNSRKEVDPLQDDVVDKAALAGLLEEPTGPPVAFKKRVAKPKSFRKKPRND